MIEKLFRAVFFFLVFVTAIRADIAKATGVAESAFKRVQFAESLHELRGRQVVSAPIGKTNLFSHHIKDEVLIKFQPGATDNETAVFFQKHGLTRIQDRFLKKIGYIKARVPKNKGAADFLYLRGSDRKLKVVEPNHVLAALTITDPLYAEQWFVPELNFDRAWDEIQNNTPVSVAIIDSGIDALHPDLLGSISEGYNFIKDSSDIADDNGHGTFVAGIIAAVPNNIGIRGLYPKARILPLKVIDADGYGTCDDVARAILYAADAGAQVINLSLGGYEYSSIMQDAVDYALGKGCIIVAAGGNDGIQREIYPAAYPDVVGVAALDKGGIIWSGSNTGSHIDIAVPGVQIVSTGLHKGYAYATGSSAAAPVVAALAAMLASEKPDLSSYAIERLMQQTARDLGDAGRDPVYGFGEIDALAALDAAVQPFHDLAVSSIIVLNTQLHAGEDVNIAIKIANTGTYPSESCTLRVRVNEKEYSHDCSNIEKQRMVTIRWPLDPETREIKIAAELLCPADQKLENNQKSHSWAATYSENAAIWTLYHHNSHIWIAGEASLVWPNSKAKPEYANNQAINEFRRFLGGDNKQYYGELINGAYQEDAAWLPDFTPGPYPNPFDDLAGYCRHFWNVGKYDADDPTQGGLVLLGITYDTAVNRAYKYWTGGFGYDGSFDVNWMNGDDTLDSTPYTGVPLEGAVSLYMKGERLLAYKYLGHIAHLLSDMALPAHVHGDQHAIPTNFENPKDSYEEYVEKNDNYRKYTGDKVAGDMVLFSKDLTLYDLFKNLAEEADDFETDDYWGGSDEGLKPARNGSLIQHKLGHEEIVSGTITDTECGVHQKYLEPRAMEYVATLYKLFWETTHPSVPALHCPVQSQLVDPDKIVFEWGAADCNECISVGYNLIINDSNNVKIFDYERDIDQELLSATKYTYIPKQKLDTAKTYWWAVFPKNISGKNTNIWNTEIKKWESFKVRDEAAPPPLPGENQPPVARFTIPSPDPPSATAPAAFQVDASSSTDSDGDPLQFSWNWGDGGTTAWLSSPVASHTYNNAGQYTITLYVKDTAAHTRSTAETINVAALSGPANLQPTVEISAAPVGTISNNTPSFQFRGTDPEGGQLSYYCSMDDFAAINVDNPEIKYLTRNTSYSPSPLSDGQHTFYVRAKDDKGALSGIASRSFTVEVPIYTAASAVIHRVVPETVTLQPGQSTSFNISFTNLSNIDWQNDDNNPNYVELHSVNSSGSAAASFLYPGDGVWIGTDKIRVNTQTARSVAGAPRNETAWFIFNGKVPVTAAPSATPVSVYFRLYNPSHGYFGEIACVRIQVVAPSTPPADDDIKPVAAITGINPGFPSVNTPATVYFNASDNVGVIRIDISYSIDGTSFSQLPGATGLAGSTQFCAWTPGEATSQGVLKIEAYDGAGNMGVGYGRIAVASVSCSNDVPPVFYNAGVVTENDYFTLGWQKVAEANAYVLRESMSSDFATSTEYIFFGADTTTVTLTGKANGTYYYQVKTRNYCGDSPWSNWEDIEVRVNTPPLQPSVPSPAEGQANVSRTVTLSWSGGDSDGTVRYAVRIGTAPGDMYWKQGFDDPNGQNTSLSLPYELEPAATYYWQVRAQDNKGSTLDGPIWNFSTGYEYPDMVVTDFTVSGAIQNGSQVTATVTVKNQGSFAMPGCQLLFFYSSAPGGEENGSYFPGNVSVPALNPGQSATVTRQLTLKNIVDGTSYLVVKIDTERYFIEADLSNNKASFSINYDDSTAPVITRFEIWGNSDGKLRTGWQTSFSYNYSDDIGIAATELYYSVDNQNTWALIANVPIIPGAGGGSYVWATPTTLPIGNNFYAKLVIRDSSGNESSQQVGPYVIVSGLAPVIRITSPATGTVWDIGSTQKIKWEVDSLNSLASVSVFFSVDNGNNHIETLIDNQKEYTWEIPENGGYISEKCRIMLYVVDSVGNRATFYSDYFTIRDTSLPPPLPWHLPAEAGTTGSPSPALWEAYSPVIKVDSAGHEHLVYFFTEDHRNDPGVYTYGTKLLYRKKTSATWSSPTEIYAQIFNTDGPLPGYGIGESGMTVDSANAPHVVWVKAGPNSAWPDCSGQNQKEIYYSFFNGSTWAAPQNISTNSADSFLPVVLADSNNNIHFIWSDGCTRSDYCQCSGTRELYHKIKYANGTWSGTQAIAGTTEGAYKSVSLQKDDAGNVYLYFTAAYPNAKLKQSVWNGTQWSSPTVIVDESTNGFEEIYAFATAMKDGFIHIAYSAFDSHDSTHDYALRYASYNGLTWSAPQTITRGALNMQRPAIVISANGSPHIIWYDQGSSGDSILYIQKTTSGWSGATVINDAASKPLSAPSDFSSQAAISSNDILSVVWPRGYKIYHNYADVSADTEAPQASITAPVANEILSPGTQYTITWNAADNVGVAGISLKYSLDGGATFTDIVTDMPNAGSYSWTVSPTPAENAQIVLTARDVAGNTASAASAGFIISDITGPLVTIAAPAGNAAWEAGSTQNILWTATDPSGVAGTIVINYSADNGSTWTTVATNEANDGTYAWLVPPSTEAACKIQIIATDTKSNSTAAASGTFSIIAENNPPLAPYEPLPPAGSYAPTSAELQWRCFDPDNDTLTYAVYWGTENPPPLAAGAQIATSYSAALGNHTTYYWKIVASDGTAEVSSPVWSFTTADVPKPPYSLSAHAVSGRQISLAWSESPSDEEGFIIERKTAEGSFAEIGVVGPNVTEYDDFSVLGHAEHVYRVKAYKGMLASGYSNEAGAVTPNNAPLQPACVSPADFASGQALALSFTWSCTDPDGDPLAYDIYFGTSEGLTLVSAGASSASYSVSGLQYDTVYFWKIIAKDTSNALTASSFWSFVTQPEPPPGAPSGMTARVLSCERIELAWEDNAQNELGFTIERKAGAEAFAKIATVSSSTYSDTAQKPSGETYEYRVRSYNGRGYSGYTTVIAATTPEDCTMMKVLVGPALLYRTIEEGISAVAPGGSVYVLDGIYEGFAIDKPGVRVLGLKSPDGTGPIISTTGFYYITPEGWTNSAAIYVAADNVTVAGFSINFDNETTDYYNAIVVDDVSGAGVFFNNLFYNGTGLIPAYTVGIKSIGAHAADARNNHWGGVDNATGPSSDNGTVSDVCQGGLTTAAGSGTKAIGKICYTRILEKEFAGSVDAFTAVPGSYSVDVLKNLAASLDVSGTAHVVVAKHDAAPVSQEAFAGNVTYFELYTPAGHANYAQLTVRLCDLVGADTKIRWFDVAAGQWKDCDAAVFQDGCLAIPIDHATTPSAVDLTSSALFAVNVNEALDADFIGCMSSHSVPLTVDFTESTAGNPAHWEWSFGDGGSSTEQNPSHAYGEKGTYGVTLKVTDVAGFSKTITKNECIVISDCTINADFSADPVSGADNLTVQFADLSTGPVTQWQWNFGDGGIAADKNPTHSYTVPGTYTVKLTASAEGCTDTEIKSGLITVNETVKKRCLLLRLIQDRPGAEQYTYAFRNFRDNRLLKSPKGLFLTWLYYVNSEEIIDIFEGSPAIKNEFENLIDAYAPRLEKGLLGDQVILSRNEIARVEKILDMVADESGPLLKSSIHFAQQCMIDPVFLQQSGIRIE